MKTKLLKISMVMTALVFVFAGASWADSGRKRQRDTRPAKRIEAKHYKGNDHQRPVHYRNKINQHRKQVYRKHHFRQRPAVRRYLRHKFYHRHKWIRNHRPVYRHDRYYGESSYDEEDTSGSEFSLAATISEPGIEFSIGTKRTW